MMELFRLIDLIKFLSRQKSVGYQGINVLVEIFENGKQDGLRKKLTLLSGFRACDLFEIGHHGINFTPDFIDGEEFNGDVDLHNRMNHSLVRYQIFDCGIRNGIARFDVILN